MPSVTAEIHFFRAAPSIWGGSGQSAFVPLGAACRQQKPGPLLRRDQGRSKEAREASGAGPMLDSPRAFDQTQDSSERQALGSDE